MTQENKELLLKDLCARLPYGVFCDIYNDTCTIKEKLQFSGISRFADDTICVRPYLRPISSMTEEESNELESITFPLMEKDWDANENPVCIRWIDVPKYMDFILSHHFDYQGLIEKGLAIEVNEQNNPYK